ncbi:hypothetical protein [Methylobacterium nodulans]|uniref:Uncharacterized protein n=1 Tax=Methylobacterium nodulans (strain LMG 21967 / CNCM I-2342 / ORS 2060) TaxID=460265 RepID=B8IC20_METNO|nr:hypothetical protein [Methylobacterium nodulans]ACL61202.1 conserved hypothetical protein [Methylobacterium nodulans ORS 2060]
MACNEDLIDALKHEHERLGQLLRVIDGGRWWTDAEPGRLKVAALQERAAQIRAYIDGIERVVGGIGG